MANIAEAAGVVLELQALAGIKIYDVALDSSKFKVHGSKFLDAITVRSSKFMVQSSLT
jgi:hypothetical protein